ncbi:TetR/AcrR family transcriptional regulator [Liquorilactobacillus aquaticus]|nr:TetR family transcriptional regulator [Liquorilactobacillus aquaticus]
MKNFKLSKTDRNIWQAFFSLLESNDFKSITVSQICSGAEISRPTFYRHYIDKYELLSSINHCYAVELKDFIDQRLEKFDITQTLIRMTEFLSNNSSNTLMLLNIHTQESDLNELFKSVLRKTFSDHVRQNPSLVKLEEFPLEYLSDLYVANAMVFLNYSLKHGLNINIVRALNQAQKLIFKNLE